MSDCDDFDPECYQAFQQAWNELPEEEQEAGKAKGAINIFLWGFKEGWKRKTPGPATRKLRDWLAADIAHSEKTMKTQLKRGVGWGLKSHMPLEMILDFIEEAGDT